MQNYRFIPKNSLTKFTKLLLFLLCKCQKQNPKTAKNCKETFLIPKSPYEIQNIIFKLYKCQNQNSDTAKKVQTFFLMRKSSQEICKIIFQNYANVEIPKLSKIVCKMPNLSFQYPKKLLQNSTISKKSSPFFINFSPKIC